jgi:hypothetical protein
LPDTQTTHDEVRTSSRQAPCGAGQIRYDGGTAAKKRGRGAVAALGQSDTTIGPRRRQQVLKRMRFASPDAARSSADEDVEGARRRRQLVDCRLTKSRQDSADEES